jgi:hypothetical protein
MTGLRHALQGVSKWPGVAGRPELPVLLPIMNGSFLAVQNR